MIPELVLDWVLFPGLLLAICLGCGQLLGAVAGRPVPALLLAPSGFALAVVITVVFTLRDETAELSGPALVVSAITGLALSFRRPRAWSGFEAWPVLAAVAVFLVFAAPVLLSGELSFGGYMKLDDSATWMAIADRIVEHGRSLEDLAPSSYEATLAYYIGIGYSIGGFLPWAIGSDLAGEDPAWTFQPYLCFLAGLLALGLAELLRGAGGSARLRAGGVFIASQAALLYAYVQWGGVKEIATAALLPPLAGFTAEWLSGDRDLRGLVPIAVVAVAILAVLGVPGLAWVIPVLVVGVGLLVRSGAIALRSRPVFLLLGVGAVAGLATFLADPGILPDAPQLTSDEERGNLGDALNPLQVLGIWPSGDFRGVPKSAILTILLLGALGPLAYVGLERAWRRRRWALLLFVVGSGLAFAGIFVVGSPWVDAKAMAIASPAALVAAAAGVGALATESETRMRAAVLAAGAFVAAGVLWSTVLTYGETWIAPRDQLEELERIGSEFSGQGPALMTEFQPYGVRHFLRELDAEGASELRRSTVLLRTGDVAKQGTAPDLDEIELAELLHYRLLVLRRSPLGSRPPAPYELVSRGDFYEVWRRPDGPARLPVAHLPLGSEQTATSVPDCGRVRRLARPGVPGARLAAVSRTRSVVIPMSALTPPAGWAVDGPTLVPGGDGQIRGEVGLAAGGDYEVWVGGSFRGRLEVTVGDETLGGRRQSLQPNRQFTSYGRMSLSAGSHPIELSYRAADLHPGSAGYALPLGPMVLAPVEPPGLPVRFFDRAEADRLCGRAWDWIELVPGG